MQFPENCPALLRHCCCGPPSNAEMLSKSLDVNSGSTATDATTSAPVVRDHLNVPSGSTAINDTLDDEVVSEFASRGRRGSLHSQIIAHQKSCEYLCCLNCINLLLMTFGVHTLIQDQMTSSRSMPMYVIMCCMSHCHLIQDIHHIS